MSKQTRVRGKNQEELNGLQIEQLINILGERGLIPSEGRLHPELRERLDKYLRERESDDRSDFHDRMRYGGEGDWRLRRFIMWFLPCSIISIALAISLWFYLPRAVESEVERAVLRFRINQLTEPNNSSGGSP